jgi:hypothetical protein
MHDLLSEHVMVACVAAFTPAGNQSSCKIHKLAMLQETMPELLFEHVPSLLHTFSCRQPDPAGR